MELKKYERKEQVVDTKLFAKDGLTFLVLERIVNQKARFVLTDHKRFVVCYSSPPHPVWIWTPDDITEEEKEALWQLCKKEHILPGQVWAGSEQQAPDKAEEAEPPIFGINMKYELADYFIRRGEEEGEPLSISLRMLVYDCPTAHLPDKAAEGGFSLMTERDVEDVAEFLYQFKQDIGIDLEDRKACRNRAERYKERENFFLWKDACGKNVAMCGYNVNQGMGSVGEVYCRSEERRKGYAQNLVYQVTKTVQEKGLLPVLYSDADYQASNRCYQKIGYQQRGELCMIGMPADKEKS